MADIFTALYLLVVFSTEATTILTQGASLQLRAIMWLPIVNRIANE